MTMGLASPKGENLATALAVINTAGRPELADFWGDLIGGLPSKNLSLPFLRRALAFEMKCRTLGGPKVGAVVDLLRVADGQSARAAVGARLQPGTHLVREWHARTWMVEVIVDGFLMGGERFDSLSGIARKIAGIAAVREQPIHRLTDAVGPRLDPAMIGVNGLIYLQLLRRVGEERRHLDRHQRVFGLSLGPMAAQPSPFSANR